MSYRLKEKAKYDETNWKIINEIQNFQLFLYYIILCNAPLFAAAFYHYCDRNSFLKGTCIIGTWYAKALYSG